MRLAVIEELLRKKGIEFGGASLDVELFDDMLRLDNSPSIDGDMSKLVVIILRKKLFTPAEWRKIVRCYNRPSC